MLYKAKMRFKIKSNLINFSALRAFQSETIKVKKNTINTENRRKSL